MSLRWMRRRLLTPLGAELTDSTIADGHIRAAVLQAESRLRFLHADDALFVPTALRVAWLRLHLHRTEPAVPGGAMDHLEPAETAARHAAAAASPGHPLHAATLLLAATATAVRAQHSDDPAALADAEREVTAAWEAHSAHPMPARHAADLAAIGFEPDRVAVDCLHELGIAHRVHFLHTGAIGHAERAIELLSVPDHEGGHSLRALTHLAAVTRLRDRPGDLDAAIDLLEAAVGESAEGDADYPGRLIAFGGMLAERFHRTASLPDLEAAVRRVAEGHAATPPQAPDRQARQGFLADLLVARFLETSQQADLDHGLAIARLAAEGAAGPGRPGLLAGYGAKLLVAGDHEAADAILAKDILRLHEAAKPLRVRSLLAKAARHSDVDGADEAIGLLATLPVEPRRELDLALARKLRFELGGDQADLERAIAGLTAIVDGPAGTAVEHLRVPVAMVHLGQALLARYHLTGAVGELEAAIRRLRAAVAGCRPEHTAHPDAQAGLAGALLVRHRLLGTSSDLDEAIEAYQRAGSAGRLSQALLTRFELGGRPQDAQDAVDAAWSAVAASPAIAHHRTEPLASFGNALLGRHAAMGDPADLDEAVTALTWAACLADGQPRVTAELVRALTLRFDPADREVAHRHLAGLSDLDGQPDRGLVLLRWGQLLEAESEAGGDPGTAGSAYRRFRDAARDRLAPAPIRFDAATAAGAIAARQHDPGGAADSYRLAVELLPELAWRGLERQDQETWLIRTGGAVADATAWAVQTHHPARAVELLESGRAVMWSQMGQLGTDLDGLSRAHPHVAARLEELRDALRAQDAHG